jgi:hypothetical protein
MVTTLRHLLIQRAARLQERPALSAPDWGRLTYAQFRNRVEGLALGIMAAPPVPDAVFSRTGTAWDWAAEVAAACCGLRWDPAAPRLDPALFGGPRFNAEAGRQNYHDREEAVSAESAFSPDLTQGEFLARLRRLNDRLEWDHETQVALPLAALSDAEGRGVLWSALYAGAHVEVVPPPLRSSLPTAPASHSWDPEPFRRLFSE